MADLVEQHVLLGVVHRFYGIQQFGFVITVAGGAGQGLDVFREAGAAVTAAGIDEVVADTGVGTDTAAHFLDIRAQALGQVGHFVHEADLGGQHGVGGVLGQLGGTDIHEDHPVVAAVERVVNFAQQVGGLFAVGAHHNPVRLHEVVDGRPFFQEFRVGDHIKIQLQAAVVQLGTNRGFHLVARANRYGGFVHHHLVIIHVLADGLGHGQHVLQVGRAVFVRRCAHGDELQGAVLDGFLGIGGKGQAAGFNRMLHDVIQARLVNGDLAVLQLFDFALVDIHAQHVVPHVRQAGTRHQANITGSENRDFHATVPEFR